MAAPIDADGIRRLEPVPYEEIRDQFHCTELVYEGFQKAGYEFKRPPEYIAPGNIWEDDAVVWYRRIDAWP